MNLFSDRSNIDKGSAATQVLFSHFGVGLSQGRFVPQRHWRPEVVIWPQWSTVVFSAQDSEVPQ